MSCHLRKQQQMSRCFRCSSWRWQRISERAGPVLFSTAFSRRMLLHKPNTVLSDSPITAYVRLAGTSARQRTQAKALPWLPCSHAAETPSPSEAARGACPQPCLRGQVEGRSPLPLALGSGGLHPPGWGCGELHPTAGRKGGRGAEVPPCQPFPHQPRQLSRPALRRLAGSARRPTPPCPLRPHKPGGSSHPADG